MARIYKVWPVPALATVEDDEAMNNLHQIVGGAAARDEAIRACLDAGALTVHWQEYDRSGNALYPTDRVVESRAVKAGRTQERLRYRKQVRTTPQEIELPPPEAPPLFRSTHNHYAHEGMADTEHEAEAVARLRSWPGRVLEWWRSR